MLIAVSIKEPDLTSELSEGFGRSKYFLLLDSVTYVSEYVLNPYASELGGAGIQSARFLIERKVEAVITAFMGFNTLRFFDSLNVKVYACKNCKVEESIKLFKDSELNQLKPETIDNFNRRRRHRNRKKLFKKKLKIVL